MNKTEFLEARKSAQRKLEGYEGISEVTLRDGPVGRVLDQHWNTLNLIADQLSNVAKEYDVAASYKDNKQGSKAAEEVMKEINGVVKKLEDLASADFSDLAKKERGFLLKYGTPEEYAEEERDKMFPN